MRKKRRYITFIIVILVFLEFGLLFSSLLGEGAISSFWSFVESMNSYVTIDLGVSIEGDKTLVGKRFYIKRDDEVVLEGIFTSDGAEFDLEKNGYYALYMPEIDGFINRPLYFVASEGLRLTYEYIYDWKNDLKMQMSDAGGRLIYEIAFFNGYTKALVTKYGMGDIAVDIADREGDSVLSCDEKMEKYSFLVELEDGFKISVKRGNGVSLKVVSTLTGEEVAEYSDSSEKVTYAISPYGIVKSGMTIDEVERIFNRNLTQYLTKLLADYQKSVSSEELGNRYANFEHKKLLLRAYDRLSENDKKLYQSLIAEIKRGGVPVVKTVGKLEYDIGEKVDLYTLVEARDAEDGSIKIDGTSTEIETDFNPSLSGEYDVLYRIKDSDGNVTTHSITLKVREKLKPTTPSVKPDTNETEPKVEEPVEDAEDRMVKKYSFNEVETELEIRVVNTKSSRIIIYSLLSSLALGILGGIIVLLKRR